MTANNQNLEFNFVAGLKDSKLTFACNYFREMDKEVFSTRSFYETIAALSVEPVNNPYVHRFPLAIRQV